MPYKEIVIEPLGPTHDRGAFCCTVPFIQHFFRKKCLDAHDLYKVRAYVARASNCSEVLGFYTLSLTALKPSDTGPDEAHAKFGTWVVPFVYLGQIAAHKNHAGCGIGSALMLHAFERTLEIAEIAGTYGLMLDAIDEKTANWYEKLSFSAFDVEEDGRIKMHIPLSTIRLALTST